PLWPRAPGRLPLMAETRVLITVAVLARARGSGRFRVSRASWDRLWDRLTRQRVARKRRFGLLHEPWLVRAHAGKHAAGGVSAHIRAGRPNPTGGFGTQATGA